MTAKLIPPLNSSAMNLESALSLSLNETELSFATIKEKLGAKVAPALFLAVSTIPHLAQATYIGIDGLMFSFYRGETEMIAAYSNISYSSICYCQQVDWGSGNLYGEPIFRKSIAARNETWFLKALNSSSGYSWFGKAWNKAQDGLFLSAVAMDGRGVISLGLRAKAVADHFAALEFHGADFQLATHDGEVIIPTRLPNTPITASNNTKLKPNGDPCIDLVGNLSCSMFHDGGSKNFNGIVSGVTYKFNCSTLEIVGVQMVYVLAYPPDKLVSLVRHYCKLSNILLLLLFILMVTSLSVFIFSLVTAAKREMFLYAALVKQMDATQQAERKGMNKSHAFATASHDIRASLAAIICSIEICNQDSNPNSVVAVNLAQMSILAQELIDGSGLLNSVLDTSKIEAGKMQLEEEEFNLAHLLEDVTDMFYPTAIKIGVEIVSILVMAQLLNYVLLGVTEESLNRSYVTY